MTPPSRNCAGRLWRERAREQRRPARVDIEVAPRIRCSSARDSRRSSARVPGAGRACRAARRGRVVARCARRSARRCARRRRSSAARHAARWSRICRHAMRRSRHDALVGLAQVRGAGAAASDAAGGCRRPPTQVSSSDSSVGARSAGKRLRDLEVASRRRVERDEFARATRRRARARGRAPFAGSHSA